MSGRPVRAAAGIEGDTTDVSALTLNVSDATLLHAMRQGDERAFEELFSRHYPRVHSVAYRITGNREDAEELALDVFVRLHRRPLEDDANVAGWLFRVVTNDALNAVRSRKRRLGWLQRFARSEPVRRLDDDPLDVVALQDDAARVRAALRRLPERQRAVLALRAAGLSYSEIAAALGMRPGSVGTTLARAERALRDAYDTEERERGGR
ncbi:MAG: RNA polymerase subunit sigma-24 [Chloroflexi bacterium]|nr:MAG: RNA polymerase subunit sigma-24 [Chloroflexota bacterium]